MKTLTGISILMNVVLAGVVVALLTNRRANNPPPPPSVPATAAALSEPIAVVSSNVVVPQRGPFHWSQLEAADYPTYVANLRGVGCPEQTIRDIVTADVDEAFYASKRDELRQKEPRVSLEHALLELKRGEDAFIASLLGTQPAPNEAATTNAVASSTRPSRGPTDTAVKMPLVFQNVDPAMAGVDTNILSTIAIVRQRFLKELGSQADPADPAYRERWKKAQADADSQLKGMIGLRAYQAYEYRARMAAASLAASQNALP
ncbi:MAG TPA: hypothetical protein VHC44_15675 [Verrucomicrobiae bacterium]|nr:hypothetical protein [Verrucomicrobiae bacterium]